MTRILGGIALLAGVLASTTALAGDKDKDGIPNKVDACKAEMETVNGFMDEDGCPDELSMMVVKVIGPRGGPRPGVEVSFAPADGKRGEGDDSAKRRGSAKTGPEGKTRFENLAVGMVPEFTVTAERRGAITFTGMKLAPGKNHVLIVIAPMDGGDGDGGGRDLPKPGPR